MSSEQDEKTHKKRFDGEEEGVFMEEIYKGSSTFLKVSEIQFGFSVHFREELSA